MLKTSTKQIIDLRLTDRSITRDRPTSCGSDDLNIGRRCISNSRIRPELDLASIDCFEGRRRDVLQAANGIVIPAAIRSAGDEPVRSVIGEDHAVLLQGCQDDLSIGAVTRDVEVGLEPESNSHRHVGRVGQARSIMSGRVDIGPLGFGDCKSQRMFYLTGFNFIVADKSGEDRKSSGIGGGPAIRTIVVLCQVKDRSTGSIPAVIALMLMSIVQFVQLTFIFIDDQNMTVAIGIIATFDRSIRRNGHRAWVTLVGIVGEVDGNSRRRIIDDHEWNAVLSGASPIGMQLLPRIGLTLVDLVDPGLGHLMDRISGDVKIPGIIGREDGAAVDGLGLERRTKANGEANGNYVFHRLGRRNVSNGTAVRSQGYSPGIGAFEALQMYYMPIFVTSIRPDRIAMDRRKFLENTCKSGLGLLLGVTALDLAKVPTATATSRAGLNSEIREIPILLIDTPELENVGSVYHFQIDDLDKDLLVVRKSMGTFITVDIKCTHKGCDIGYDAENTCFLCPCHDSRFELDGSVKNGPAEKPITAYRTLFNDEAQEVTILVPVAS
jgi:nitrite reductase/ring-hydroxylating ferredoxin subunit